jgi:LEA14-like dessication related protein
MRAAAFLVALGYAALCGCASMLPKLQAPQLQVTAIDFAGGNMQQQQIALTVHAANPNDRAITVRGIDCKLELSGNEFAVCATTGAFTLPPLAATDFTLNVMANVNSLIASLAANLGRNRIDYHIYGEVHLAGLVRTIPFDQRGSVRLR